jgi:formylglycine-generating enzyme required for sulfatase activity
MPVPNMTEWMALAPAARRRRVETLLPASSGFSIRDGATPFPEWVHRTTGTEWLLVPGGPFTMGLSAEEEAAARRIEDPPPLTIDEMRPCIEVDVGPFLAMKFPVATALAVDLAPSFKPPRRSAPTAPANLTREEAEGVAVAVACRIPLETQWEFACRGGTRTLFFFGDELPDHARLQELMSTSGSSRAGGANPLGLRGMFEGNWCQDPWHARHGSFGEDRSVFVVRGGGSAFWPWQDAGEWAFCISANRAPSTELEDGRCGLRLVFELR